MYIEMFQNQITILLCCVLTVAKSSVVIDERCDFKDHECLKSMYQDIFKKTADGVPSMNIPRLDPMHLSNAVVTLSNSFKITMMEGTVTGLKNCIFDDVEIHHEENFRITYNLTCSVEVNATDKVEIPKLLMEELTGEASAEDVYGYIIKARFTMEKYRLYIDLPFGFEKRNDDIYLYVNPLDIYHDNNDLAFSTFTVDEVDKQNKVNGEILSNYIQKNLIELNLMFPITEKLGEFLQTVEETLATALPANKFFKDDISNYVKS